MIQIDLKEFLETLTGISVYPNVVPQKAKLPAIMYKTTGFNRDTDSNLSESNVVEYTFQIFVIAKSAKDMITISEDLQDKLENYSGNIGNSSALILRIRNAVDLYNYSQNTNERTIDLNIKIKR